VRWYSLTKQEIQNLATLQGLAALFVGLTTFLLGVWVSCNQAVELAEKGTVDEAVLAKWQAFSDIAFWSALATGGLSTLFLVMNGLAVWGIYKEHDHRQ